MLRTLSEKTLCTQWCKKEIINQKSNHGKQEHLGKNPEHSNHCTHRHRHHLRGDFLHGRVKIKRGHSYKEYVLSLLSGAHQNIDGFSYQISSERIPKACNTAYPIISQRKALQGAKGFMPNT